MPELLNWVTDEERALLVKLAAAVPDNGRIVEIGTLYGATTIFIAKAAPRARVVTIDNYSWLPEGPNSPALVTERLVKAGVSARVDVVMGDSAKIGGVCRDRADLVFIDGDHSKVGAFTDIYNFSKLTNVMAVHDYGNQQCHPGVKVAVDGFIKGYPEWRIAERVGMLVVLRKEDADA